jgi:DNA end-binding protein Ku
MARSAFWKGYLKLSLVSCPVAMNPATTEANTVRFHTLNRQTGNRVIAQYVDALTDDPVAEEDEARGYAAAEDRTLILEEDELASVVLESTRTIDIDMFVEAGTVPWTFYDRPHYLVPDDKVGEEAFAVIREAMQATGTVGIARVVLYRRERAVLLEPRDKGIVAWTLRYGDEVREPAFAGVRSETTGGAVAGMMRQVIEMRTRPWDPSMTTDPVQERLLELIAAKRKRRPKRTAAARPRPRPESETSGNVIDITEALRRSLAGDASSGRR